MSTLLRHGPKRLPVIAAAAEVVPAVAAVVTGVGVKAVDGVGSVVESVDTNNKSKAWSALVTA